MERPHILNLHTCDEYHFPPEGKLAELRLTQQHQRESFMSVLQEAPTLIPKSRAPNLSPPECYQHHKQSIYIYIHTCMYTYTYTYLFIWLTYVFITVYVSIYIYGYIYMCVCACIYIWELCRFMYMPRKPHELTRNPYNPSSPHVLPAQVSGMTKISPAMELQAQPFYSRSQKVGT